MRHMKLVVLTALSFLIVGKSYAEDWGFSGGLGVKYQTVDFKVATESFKPLFVSNSLNVAAAKDKIYFSLEYDISVKDHQELTFDANEVLFIDMSRSDVNLTFGYLISNSTSIFMGYKQASLDVKLNSVISPNGGTPGNEPRAQDVEFSDEGIYIGASYSQNIGETGVLSYSAAYADLDGEVSIISSQYDGFTNSIRINSARTEGATSGISLGLTWNDGFADSVAYNVALKINLYEFDDETLTAGDDLSTDETFTILSVGLRKYF
jgi:hypothetical protein